MTPTRPILCLLATLCSFLITPRASLAATVSTLDGRTLEGNLKLTVDGLMVTPRGIATSHRIPIADILLADFRAVPATRPATAPAPRWTARDIGQVRAYGSARIAPGGGDGSVKAIISGAGDTLGTADAFHFLYQPLTGDGALTAKVTSLHATDRLAKAGLMIRGSTHPAAPFVAIVAHAADRPVLLFRSRPGASVEVAGAARADIPLFLRLTRSGNRFVAYASTDGREWEEVAAATVNLPAATLAGAAVASRLTNTLTRATFERLSLVSDAAENPGPLGRKLQQGVILRDGSRLGGRITAVTDSAVRLLRELELTIPITDIAQIQLQPRQADLGPQTPMSTPGVLLVNGDFVEGEFRKLEGGDITLSSILFGLTRLPERQVRSILLRDLGGAAAAYEVRLAEGSILMSDSLTPQRDSLLVQVRGAGAVTVGGSELMEIRPGPSRRTTLFDLPPRLLAEGGGGILPPLTVDATPTGTPLSLSGRAWEKGLGLSTGSRISYDLPEGQRMLAFTAGVPDGILPVASVRFIIKIAGKEVWKSPSRNSLDEPLEVKIPLAGAKEIEITCEPATPNQIPTCGLIVDAILIQ